MRTKIDRRVARGYVGEAVVLGGLGLTVVPPKERGNLAATVRVRVDGPFLRKIDAIAQETGHKRSEVVRRLMVAGLELHEQDKKGKK